MDRSGGSSMVCMVHLAMRDQVAAPLLHGEMPTLVPSATYLSPSEAKPVSFLPGDGPHTTDGKTTKISDIVINAGGQDRDKPSAAKNTPLGSLRAQLTSIQDMLNTFLTEKMSNKRKFEDEDVERRVLDNGVDEDSESE